MENGAFASVRGIGLLFTSLFVRPSIIDIRLTDRLIRAPSLAQSFPGTEFLTSARRLKLILQGNIKLPGDILVVRFLMLHRVKVRKVVRHLYLN